MPIIISVVMLALILFALIDLIMSDEWQVKYLPKLTWVFVIVFLPLIGSVIWLAIGKDRVAAREAPAPAPALGDPGRPSRAVAESTTEAELAALEREIAFHEKQAEVKRLEALVERKRREKGHGAPDSQS